MPTDILPSPRHHAEEAFVAAGVTPPDGRGATANRADASSGSPLTTPVADLSRAAPSGARSAQPPVLPIAAGIISIVLGCLAIAIPRAFDAPVYSPVLFLLPRYAMALVVGGVLMLLAHTSRSRQPGRLQAGLTLLGVLPIAVLSALLLVRSRIWPAPTLGIPLAIGVFTDALRDWEVSENRWKAVPGIAIAAAVTGLLQASVLLWVPHTLRIQESSWLAVHRVPMAGVMLGAALLLVAGWLVPRLRVASQVAAAAGLLLLVAAFALVGRWPAVATYGLLAVFLAAEPWLRGSMALRVAERFEKRQASAEHEMAAEMVAWGSVVIIALAAVAARGGERLGLAVLVLVASVFTVLWFHFPSARRAGVTETVIGIGVYTFFVAVLVSLTGGLHSQYFLAYMLPVVALAWTRTPETILIPLTIPVGAMAIDAGVVLYGQALPVSRVFDLLAPRLGVLLMVAGFSYLLARRNLDEQKRSQAAHDQLRTVLASMAEGLVTTDAAGRIVLWNPAAIRLMEKDPSTSMGGQHLTEVLPLRRPDGTPLTGHEHPLNRVLAGRRVVWERVLAAGARGAAPLAVAGTPFFDEHGTQCAILLLRDARSDVEMEQIREDFFYIASHELRTPLTIMKGNLELAQEAALEGPLGKTIGEALSSLRRLIRMVNDFLDAARLEHGSFSMRIEDGLLPDITQHAVEITRPDAERKGLEIIYRQSPDLPPVRMDTERAVQILINLLGNSLRHTTEGRIEIWHEVQGKIVDTLIRDTGAGISPEHHGRLFTRFGQVERGLTRASGGSGLGLYISRKLAEQMGGTVELRHSAPGEGSTFALRLRAVRSPTRP